MDIEKTRRDLKRAKRLEKIYLTIAIIALIASFCLIAYDIVLHTGDL
jgi:hypothetical protein